MRRVPRSGKSPDGICMALKKWYRMEVEVMKKPLPIGIDNFEKIINSFIEKELIVETCIKAGFLI